MMGKLKDKDTRWMKVRGPMSATIGTLLDLGWRPVHPTSWIPSQNCDDYVDFYENHRVSEHKVIHMIEKDLTKKIWREADDGGTNGGFRKGKPSMHTINRAYKQLEKEEKHQESKAR